LEALELELVELLFPELDEVDEPEGYLLVPCDEEVDFVFPLLELLLEL